MSDKLIRLISQGPGHYEAGTEGEDDHVLVLLDPTFETECDEPHPVRMRKDALRASYSNDSYGQQAFEKFVANVKALVRYEIHEATSLLDLTPRQLVPELAAL